MQSGCAAVRKKLSDRLKELGYQVSHMIVWRLPPTDEVFSKYNKKRRAGAQSPERDEQFRNIASQKKAFSDAGQPIISVTPRRRI